MKYQGLLQRHSLLISHQVLNIWYYSMYRYNNVINSTAPRYYSVVMKTSPCALVWIGVVLEICLCLHMSTQAHRCNFSVVCRSNKQLCSQDVASYSLRTTIDGYSELQSSVQKETNNDVFCIHSQNRMLSIRSTLVSDRHYKAIWAPNNMWPCHTWLLYPYF